MAELNYKIFCHQLQRSTWVAQISLDLIDRPLNYGKCIVGNVGRWGKGIALVLWFHFLLYFTVYVYFCVIMLLYYITVLLYGFPVIYLFPLYYFLHISAHCFTLYIFLLSFLVLLQPLFPLCPLNPSFSVYVCFPPWVSAQSFSLTCLYFSLWVQLSYTVPLTFACTFASGFVCFHLDLLASAWTDVLALTHILFFALNKL